MLLEEEERKEDWKKEEKRERSNSWQVWENGLIIMFILLEYFYTVSSLMKKCVFWPLPLLEIDRIISWA